MICCHQPVPQLKELPLLSRRQRLEPSRVEALLDGAAQRQQSPVPTPPGPCLLSRAAPLAWAACFSSLERTWDPELAISLELDTGEMAPPLRPAAVLRRSLRFLLPIAAAVTVVVLPMAMLYEHARQGTLKEREHALIEASIVRISQTFREVKSNSGVVLTVPAMQQLWEGTQASAAALQNLRSVFRGQLREYRRYASMRVYDANGRALVVVNRQASTAAAPSELERALQIGRRLGSNDLWFSPVFWPTPPQTVGLEAAEPCVLAVRPIFDRGGQRRGVLVFVVRLGPLALDFDRIANGSGDLQRGYLISSSGQVLNPALGAGTQFSSRHPDLWRQMGRQSAGVMVNGDGMFLFRHLGPWRQLLEPDLDIPSGAGAPPSAPGGRPSDSIAVVIQIPTASLYRTSVFARPEGLVLLGLLYLLVAVASLALAFSQERGAIQSERERALLERLQLISREAAVGMCLCDPATGRFLFANPALCEFFGRSEADLQQCTWQDLTHPEDLAADQQLAAQLHEGSVNHYRLRKRFLLRDGATIWGDLVVACTRHPDGTIRDLIGQISDVTDLVTQSTYIATAAAAGVVGVWDWDVERDRLHWDAVMYRLYGVSEDDCAGTREAWEQALHPDDRDFVTQELQASLKGWRPYQPQFRVVWPDGSIHHIQVRSQTVFSEDGRPVRMVGVNYDVTTQIQLQEELESERALLAATFDALVDPLLSLTPLPHATQAGDTVHDGQEFVVAELNPAAAQFFQCSVAQLLGQPLHSMLPPATHQAITEALGGVLQTGDTLIADASSLLDAGSGSVMVDLRAVKVADGVVLSFRDVSERQLSAQRLAESEQRFRLLAENSSDAVFLASEGIIRWMSPAITPMLGWTPADWIEHRFEEYCHPDDVALAQQRRAEITAGASRVTRLRLSDITGTWRWVEIHAGPFRDNAGRQTGIACSMRTVDSEVAAEAELDRRARTDELTGLFNRKEILDRLQRLVQQQRRSDDRLAVVFCDIDHFKAINDTWGHAGGDAVLQALANRLLGRVRQGDLVGRIGGDELLVVLVGIADLDEGLAITRQIHRAAKEPLQLATGQVTPTLSMGVTLIMPEETIDAVIARADQAMYEAKQQGRDRVLAFS